MKEQESLHLTRFAEKVTLIRRRDEFRITRVLVEQLLEKANGPNPDSNIKYSTTATTIEGEAKVPNWWNEPASDIL